MTSTGKNLKIVYVKFIGTIEHILVADLAYVEHISYIT